MGGEWIETTVGDFCPFEYGRSLPERMRQPGPYPVFGSNGRVGFHVEPLVNGPGIIIGRKGTVGAVHFSKEPFWPIDTTFYVTEAEHRDLRFTYYLLCSLGLDRMNADSAVPGLNRNAAHARRILVPHLPEQRAIARILGTLDDKIELNRRMNETLEAMAQALFKSWFVDFDPVVVNAIKADNPIPDKFAARAAYYRANPDALGLPEDILRLFPARFVDSELGPTPEGWEVGPLSKIANLHTETATPSQEPEAIWEYYSIPAFDEGRMPKHEHGKNIKSGKYRVPAKAVLVSKLNPQFPRVWLPDVIDETRAVCSTEFLPFVPCKSQWHPITYEILRSNSVQEKIRSSATGSTGSRQRVKPKAVAELNIVLASERLLDTFSGWIAPIHNRLLLNKNESRTLVGLRDTILPKLISGELRVPDVEKILEEV
ncbi:MAG: restriction endonuclease subunit S [Hydrogenophilus thermoluteolus]